MTARQKLDYRVKPSGLCLMLNHFFFVPNQTIGSIHARRLTSHEAELTKMEQARMEKAGEVSHNAQIRCPACGKLSPTRADACSCGFRFGRALG
jgi:hypothetical protein